MKKAKDTERFKRPQFVLTDEARFYLATRDVSDDNESDLFFIASLYLPRQKGGTLFSPRTEVAAFEDSTSADIYHNTVSAMCRVNAQSDIGQEYKKEIERFNQMVFSAESDQER